MYGNFEGFPEKHSIYIVWVGNVTANGSEILMWYLLDINWLVLRISEPSTSSALLGLVTDMTDMTDTNLSTKKQLSSSTFRPWWPWLFKANPTRWRWFADGDVDNLIPLDCLLGFQVAESDAPKKNMFGNISIATDGT